MRNQPDLATLTLIATLCPPGHTRGPFSAEQRSRFRSGARSAKAEQLITMACRSYGEGWGDPEQFSIEAIELAARVRNLGLQWCEQWRDGAEGNAIFALYRLAIGCIMAADALRPGQPGKAEAESSSGKPQRDSSAPELEAEAEGGNRQTDIEELLARKSLDGGCQVK